MLYATTLIVLFLVMCVYGISVIGIKKYEVITTIIMLRKKEILGLVLCLGILFLGILMQVSRCPMTAEGGLVTSVIGGVVDTLFDKNVSITSLVVLLVTIIPAYIFQVFTVSKIVDKLNIPYAQLFFYMIIYAVNIGLYSKMVFSAGEAVIYLLFSAFLYYLVMIMNRVRGKKDYAYILGFVLLFIVLLFFENSVNWSIMLLSIITMIESVFFAWYLGKSIILRKTLRRVGAIILLLVFTWANVLIG